MSKITRREVVFGLAATTISLPLLSVRAVSAQGAPLVVSELTSYKVQYPDGIHVIGMLENQGPEALGVRTIAVSLLNPTGETVGAGSAVYKPTMLEPGQRAGWLALVDGNPGFSEIRVQSESGPAQVPYAPQLTHEVSFEGLTTHKRAASSRARITGQIINLSAQAVGRARVLGAVYAASGELLAVNQTYGKLEKLGPQMRTPFELEFRSDVTDPSIYELYTEAWIER